MGFSAVMWFPAVQEALIPLPDLSPVTAEEAQVEQPVTWLHQRQPEQSFRDAISAGERRIDQTKAAHQAAKQAVQHYRLLQQTHQESAAITPGDRILDQGEAAHQAAKQAVQHY